MRLGLGTVQFGLDYGLGSSPGSKTPPSEVDRILRFAAQAKIEVLDTARSYGDSEAVLGQVLGELDVSGSPESFKLVTKFSGAETVRESFSLSLEKLKKRRVYGLLAHRPLDLVGPNGQATFKVLQQLKDGGFVQKIGASVYTSEEIDALLDGYAVDLVQLPMNVLDQRLIRSGTLQRLKERGVEIHLRSIFLQGLLLTPVSKVNAFFAPIRSTLQRWQDFLSYHGLSTIEGALCFAQCVKEIDCVLIGVNDCVQLKLNLQAFERVKSIAETLKLKDFEQFSVQDPMVLNPSQWRLS